MFVMGWRYDFPSVRSDGEACGRAVICQEYDDERNKFSQIFHRQVVNMQIAFIAQINTIEDEGVY